jgi:hypothetical protein
MKKYNIKLYIKVLFALILIFIVFFFIPKTRLNLVQKPENTINTQSFTLKIGEVNTQLSFASNTAFYDALVQARDIGQITFLGKNYPGLGFFVTDFETLHAGNGKYLLYYINGKEANVGVSSYILKDGDIIEWKLK